MPASVCLSTSLKELKRWQGKQMDGTYIVSYHGIYGRMGGWTDGWMDGWMDSWDRELAMARE